MKWNIFFSSLFNPYSFYSFEHRLLDIEIETENYVGSDLYFVCKTILQYYIFVLLSGRRMIYFKNLQEKGRTGIEQ